MHPSPASTEKNGSFAAHTSPSSSSAMPVPVRPHTRQVKRAPVPLILESFPTPPTYIPSSPLESPSNASYFPLSPKGTSTLSRSLSALPNPPPSLPPVAPLPPLPGPSPISDHESILIMSSNRSRRSSRLSIQSSSQSLYSAEPSHPSIHSPTEAVRSMSTGAVSPFTSTNPFGVSRRKGSIGSVRSLPSYSSNGLVPSQNQALPQDKPSTLGYAISEEESAEPPQVPSSLSNKENVGEMPRRRELRPQQQAQEPNDMHSNPSARAANPDSHAQNLHVRMRANRSKSESHKKSLRSRSTSPSAAGSATSASTISAKVPPVPRDRPQERSASPDIADILSTTPRPRTRVSSVYSNASSRDSESFSRPGSMRRYASDLQGARRRSSVVSRSESIGPRTQSPADIHDESWNDESFVEDYGNPINGEDRFVGVDPELEAQLDGEGSDSDSSIDLHTPLPHLMLRHGLLSPHSKLLPESNQLLAPLPDSRPESIMSVTSNASVMTKSGLFKDQRDTPQRRVRHRDGRQLRAGMGLTTGLGWSDSEDEDAPSPLTRRLSTLNLSNRASSSSLRASKHPLSRSQSSSTLQEEDNDASTASRKPTLRPRPPLPPTSWQKRSASGGTSNGGRASTGSVGSAFSLTLSIPEDETNVVGTSPSESSTRQTSTASLPMPVTPDDPPVQQSVDKDKGLPPLPVFAARKAPPALSLRTPATSSGSSNNVELRPRTLSNTSSVSSAGAVAGHGISVTQSTPVTATSPTTSAYSPTSVTTPSPPSYTPRMARTPRPLRLSQSFNLGVQPGELPQRSGQVLTYNRNLHDQQRMRVASGPTRPGVISNPSTAPTTPTTPGFSKPMPRTGTGMVYRTSSNPGMPPQNRVRMPATVSQSLSASSSGRGAPPTPSVPKPIAL